MRFVNPARLLGLLALSCLVVACLTQNLGPGPRHGWWDGLGPVIPHDAFPEDCQLCHVGEGWHTLTDDFVFDHEAETGVPLIGAHDRAQCLRCHNDRGPVSAFESRGCLGCHEDFHQGQLGSDCTSCHRQENWLPFGQIELHNRTRFPLVGAHVAAACWRCHEGGEVGIFLPTDTQCLTCHSSDLARAKNPDHVALGWVNRCDRCHQPTHWNDADLN